MCGRWVRKRARKREGLKEGRREERKCQKGEQQERMERERAGTNILNTAAHKSCECNVVANSNTEKAFTYPHNSYGAII